MKVMGYLTMVLGLICVILLFLSSFISNILPFGLEQGDLFMASIIFVVSGASTVRSVKKFERESKNK